MIIRYPFEMPNINDVLVISPLENLNEISDTLIQIATRIQSGETLNQDDLTFLMIVRPDKEALLEESPPSNTSVENRKKQIGIAIEYIPVNVLKNSNSNVNYSKTNSFYVSPNTVILAESYIPSKTDVVDNKYIIKSAIKGVQQVLTDMKYDFVLLGGTLMINNKIVMRMTRYQVSSSNTIEVVYCILDFNQEDLDNAMQNNKSTNFYCENSVVNKLNTGMSGLKNEIQNFDEKDFFQRLLNYILNKK